MNEINLTVNGREYALPSKPGEMLSGLLRERLKLTGTKIGCEEAECGACTVLINGEPMLSCVYPAERANGKEIVTVEGLAQNGKLHPLQEAFIQHGAVQCGFCIPGQLMTSYALLKRIQIQAARIFDMRSKIRYVVARVIRRLRTLFSPPHSPCKPANLSRRRRFNSPQKSIK